MSFDLYFCAQPKHPTPDASEFRRFFEQTDGFRVEDFENGPQALYENQDTGVYCIFDLFDQGEDTPIPATMQRAPLAFNLNFVRPTFFARETMPIVASVIDRFRLLVVDPQSDETPDAKAADDLVRSWERSNESSIRTLFGRDSSLKERTAYLPRGSADAWWTYTAHYRRLNATLAEEDIYVPTVFLLRPITGREVLRLISWPEEVDRMLVPDCDGFILQRKQARRLRKPAHETRIVTGVEATLGPILQLHRIVDIPELPSDRGRVSDVLSKMYERSEPFVPEEFERVSPDRCVDVDA